MNKFILCAMDRENKTKEELGQNLGEAKDISYKNYGNILHETVEDVAYFAATNRPISILISLDKYFKLTGEDRSEYEKAIKEFRG